MSKKVAVIAVNPVNGLGLFEYLEAFYENGISYKVYAVADSVNIKTNSGIAIETNDTINNLRGRECEYDALVFACGDAIPEYRKNQDQPYNITMMEVIKTFGDLNKIMIGHCAAAMMFDFTSITKGVELAIKPIAKPAISTGIATDEKYKISNNFFTAQDENYIHLMIPELIEALKE